MTPGRAGDFHTSFRGSPWKLKFDEKKLAKFWIILAEQCKDKLNDIKEKFIGDFNRQKGNF